MAGNSRFSKQIILLAGDLITLALVTVYGFARHRTLGSAGERLLVVFLALAASWLLVAPFLGAFDPQRTADGRQLWRPFWAMVVAGPFAAWMRGAITHTPIQPIFVVVLGGFSALGLLAWRFLYWLLISRRHASSETI